MRTSKNAGLVMGRRGWAGPGLGRAGRVFDMMGCRPARLIIFSEDGPRPGPAHHIFKNSRPGPVHIFFQKSCPGPSYGSEAHETRAPYGPPRKLRGPAHMLSRTFRGTAAFVP